MTFFNPFSHFLPCVFPTSVSCQTISDCQNKTFTKCLMSTGGDEQSGYGSFLFRAGLFCVLSDVLWLYLVKCVNANTNNNLFTLTVYSPDGMNRNSACYMGDICRLHISFVYCYCSTLLINFCGWFSLVLVHNVPTNYASKGSQVSLSLDLRVPFIFSSYIFTAPPMFVCGYEFFRVSCVC